MGIVQPQSLLALFLLVQLASSCQDENCNNCDTYLSNKVIT